MDELQLNGNSSRSSERVGVEVPDLERFERLVDRVDTVVDRVDRLAARLDRWTDRVEKIEIMTQANSEGQQALENALVQLDQTVTQGFADLSSYVDSLNNEIAALGNSASDSLKAAATRLTDEVGRISQGFSTFKQNPDVPVDPTPVPEPAPAPDPGPVSPSDPTVDPTVDPGAGPGPVGPAGGGDNLGFNP